MAGGACIRGNGRFGKIPLFHFLNGPSTFALFYKKKVPHDMNESRSTLQVAISAAGAKLPLIQTKSVPDPWSLTVDCNLEMAGVVGTEHEEEPRVLGEQTRRGTRNSTCLYDHVSFYGLYRQGTLSVVADVSDGVINCQDVVRRQTRDHLRFRRGTMALWLQLR